MNIKTIKKWRWIDQTSFGKTFQPLASFATDDTLCTTVGTGGGDGVPIIRTWVHDNTVVLGIQDSRLPFIHEGMTFLQNNGFQAIVRNSGGLAVVLDQGILNVSLIFQEAKTFSINSGYEAMYELIKEMFKRETSAIEAREIIGSYCPGSYDLSIDGKKFAGISQRRVRGGVAVQIYLCVNGSGSNRAALIKQFYEIAVQGLPTKFDYPHIIPDTMASLSELLQINLSIQDVMIRLLQVMKSSGDTVIEATQLKADELLLFEENLVRMKKRNEGLGAG